MRIYYCYNLQKTDYREKKIFTKNIANKYFSSWSLENMIPTLSVIIVITYKIFGNTMLRGKFCVITLPNTYFITLRNC